MTDGMIETSRVVFREVCREVFVGTTGAARETDREMIDELLTEMRDSG